MIKKTALLFIIFNIMHVFPIDMIYIKGSDYTIGIVDNKPITVKINDYFISKYEINQKTYAMIMGNNPSKIKGDLLPVESVSWYEAVEFCNKLSFMERLDPVYVIVKNKKDPNYFPVKPDEDKFNWWVKSNWDADGYRLPSSIEWEYAAKSGDKAKNYTYSGSNSYNDVAWFLENSNKTLQFPGKKKPNELGIFDLSGNVSEWCWDWFPLDNSSSVFTSDKGSISGSYKICKGGNYLTNFKDGVLSKNYLFQPGLQDKLIGIRIVRNPKTEEIKKNNIKK